MHDLIVDERLIETAKACAVVEREMALSAEQLFDTLVDGPSWKKWTGIIQEVIWTSPEPFAIGTTRTLKIMGGVRLDEVFWRWEPNRRMSFSINAASIGWLRALSEVYEITPLSSERCTLRWVVAASFSGWINRIEPVIGPTFQLIQRRMAKRLERVARQRS